MDSSLWRFFIFQFAYLSCFSHWLFMISCRLSSHLVYRTWMLLTLRSMFSLFLNQRPDESPCFIAWHSIEFTCLNFNCFWIYLEFMSAKLSTIWCKNDSVIVKSLTVSSLMFYIQPTVRSISFLVSFILMEK